MENTFHEALKRRWSIAKTKGKDCKLENTIFCQKQITEVFATMEGINAFVIPWNGVAVDFGDKFKAQKSTQKQLAPSFLVTIDLRHQHFSSVI
jgi:hypothetical protein